MVHDATGTSATQAVALSIAGVNASATGTSKQLVRLIIKENPNGRN